MRSPHARLVPLCLPVVHLVCRGLLGQIASRWSDEGGRRPERECDHVAVRAKGYLGGICRCGGALGVSHELRSFKRLGTDTDVRELDWFLGFFRLILDLRWGECRQGIRVLDLLLVGLDVIVFCGLRATWAEFVLIVAVFVESLVSDIRCYSL
jgi:hypothetical protein